MTVNSDTGESHGFLAVTNRYRVAVFAWLSATAIVLTLLARPQYEAGIYYRRLAAEKIRWKQCADVVLMGDSRTQRNLSPAEMARHVTGYRIFNYAFDSAGFSAEYLLAGEGVLDPQSPKKILILGITPLSLTPHAVAKNRFKETISRGAEAYFDIYLGDVLRLVEPMSAREACSMIAPSLLKRRYYRECFTDGWIASSQAPEDHQEALIGYRNLFTKETSVDHRILERLAAQVRLWTSSGIRVFGLRPPSCTEMAELENEVSGFREAAVVAAFTAAGGVWMPTRQDGYNSYDGAHLRYDSAQEFSREVALFVRQSLEAPAAQPAVNRAAHKHPDSPTASL